MSASKPAPARTHARTKTNEQKNKHLLNAAHHGRRPRIAWKHSDGVTTQLEPCLGRGDDGALAQVGSTQADDPNIAIGALTAKELHAHRRRERGVGAAVELSDKFVDRLLLELCGAKGEQSECVARLVAAK
jgi:hypothetical protein